MGRAIILVMDSFGIGATADAERFGDSGADTLGHIARAREDSGAGPLRLPNLARLGLFHASRDSTGDFPAGVDTDSDIIGAYGFAAELSSGKDTAECLFYLIFYIIILFSRTETPTGTYRPLSRAC